MFGHLKIYTVHIKADTPAAQQKPVFVKEGFNIFAFAFWIFWALYHRLWRFALLIVAIYALIVMIGQTGFLGDESLMIIQIAFQVLIGFHANDWLRASLTRKGYILADISASDSMLRAEQRYFERYLAQSSI